MAKRKKKTTKADGPEIEAKPTVDIVVTDRPKFLTREMRYILFYVIWFMGFLGIIFWYSFIQT